MTSKASTATNPLDKARVHPAAAPAPATTLTRAAAVTGIVGGLAFFADLSLHAIGLLDRGYYVVATVIALAMLGLPATWKADWEPSRRST